jgi:hypothetical protein
MAFNTFHLGLQSCTARYAHDIFTDRSRMYVVADFQTIILHLDLIDNSFGDQHY